MAIFVALLRGVNLAGHHRVAMDDLRALYEAEGLKNPQTYIQSGNVVFESSSKDAASLASKLNRAMEKRYGFRADIALRTLPELEALIAVNPLAARGIEPAQNIVVFLTPSLKRDAAEAVCKVAVAPEEVHTDGSHLFCYYPNGQGRSKLGAAIEKYLSKHAITGTARNWNTVLKLLEMARAQFLKLQ